MSFEAIEAQFERMTEAVPVRPTPPALAAARADIAAAALALRTIPDESLTRMWGWIGGSEDTSTDGGSRRGGRGAGPGALDRSVRTTARAWKSLSEGTGTSSFPSPGRATADTCAPAG